MPDSDFDRVEEQRRVKDVESARSIFNRMQTDNSLRFTTIVNTRNQLEGGRPTDPRLLAEMGAEWQTNVNFGDAQAARDKTLMPYFKMVNDVPNKIVVKIPGKAPHKDSWQMAFAEAFDEFIEEWGAGYEIEFRNFASNFVNFGPGIVHFPIQDSPRYKAVNVQRVLWPKNARMNPEDWEVMAFTQDVTPSDLYKKIRTPEEAKKSKFLGWNENAIKAAIVSFNSGIFTPDPRDYTRWQDMMVNNDIAVATPFEPLQLVWLFVKEFSGKVGAYVFTQQGNVNEFIMRKQDYADDFRHIAGAVWYDTGVDSMIHSIKGFGIKNFFFSTLINRTKSRFVDGSTFCFGLNFQRGEDHVADEAPPVENYGPTTVFPPGLTPITTQPAMQQGAGVIEMLENNQAQNNSLYRDQGQGQIAETDTAKQAEILASMQADATQSVASIFLAQYGENIYAEQIRRLRKKGSVDPDAKEFQNRLREMGVPEEVIFKTKIRVKTGANAGMANPAVRAQKFQQGMALMKIPGVNGRWFLEQYIANTYGAEAVDNALLPEGAQSDPMQRNTAKQENLAFAQGQPLEAVPEDNHFVHLQEHLPPLKQIAMGFRKTGNVTPEQAVALTIGLEHSSEHMQFLSEDETAKDEFQQVNGLFREIQSVARGILSRLAQQQKQQQNPQLGPSPIA